MTLDRDWLLSAARHERDALGRTIQYTDPAKWEEESPREGWRVKDVLAYLAATEVAAAAVVGGEPAAEVEEFRKSLDARPFEPEAWYAWAVDRRRDEPPMALATEWGRAADLFLRRAGAGDPEDWDRRMVRWIAGDIRLGYMVQARVAEWWVHGENVREGGGLPPRSEHFPVYCVNDLAIRMIPYSLSREGLSFPGKSVQVRLEGVGEGTWHQGLEAGEVPPEDKKPDAVVAGRGRAFAEVAGHRTDPEVALYEGVVQGGGEVEVFEAVLRTLRIVA